MTQAQIDQVERACERATVEHIQVMAQGRMKVNNERFFLTNSTSRPAGYNVVRLVAHGSRLACDCQGSQRGYICNHVGAVRMHLEHMASRAQAHAEAVEAAMQEEVAAAAVVKPQQPQASVSGGWGCRFSIFK